MNISREHRELSFMLMCPAWSGLYKAKIAERVTEYYRLLLEPSTTDTKKEYPDDYLRGAIAALKWAIEWPDRELNAAVIASQDDVVPTAAGEPNQPLFGGRPNEGVEVLNGGG
jgi:hypothetical protein